MSLHFNKTKIKCKLNTKIQIPILKKNHPYTIKLSFTFSLRSDNNYTIRDDCKLITMYQCMETIRSKFLRYQCEQLSVNGVFIFHFGPDQSIDSRQYITVLR